MTAFSRSYPPDACSSIARASAATLTVADPTAGFNPEDEVPADSQQDKAAPDDVGERAEELPDPAPSYDSSSELITIALIPRASNVLMAILRLLLILCAIAVVVVTVLWSRDTLTFALMLVAVFLCYRLRNDSDDHASLPGKRIGCRWGAARTCK